MTNCIIDIIRIYLSIIKLLSFPYVNMNEDVTINEGLKDQNLYSTDRTSIIHTIVKKNILANFCIFDILMLSFSQRMNVVKMVFK